MNKKKIAQFHSQLESIRSELLGYVEKSNQSVKESEIGQIADISDDAARAYNRQLEGELGEQEWKKLKQVDMAIKKIVIENVAPHLKPTAIFSSNTSGLSLTEMSSFLPEIMRPQLT